VRDAGLVHRAGVDASRRETTRATRGIEGVTMSEADNSTRIAVVTGANSGIGKVTVTTLLKKGYRVIATARSKERGEAALADWQREVPGAKIELVLCNLSDLDSVRAAAKSIAGKVDRIHVLVNNAGGIIGERHVTKEGWEETLAGNHLGPFVLTRELLPLLERGAPARIVNVASEAHRQVSDMRWDDLSYAGGYSSMKAYGQSKLANILFTRELARRLDPAKITANSLHPGVVRTRFGETGSGALRFAIALIRPFLIDEVKGADTQIWLATDPSVEGKSGGYYDKRKLKTPTKAGRSDEGAKRLWELSEKLAGPPA
jgi:NAD(P)-dependent dehydrogenase (short-subunit alcohol dehydrogenase family)